MVNICKNEYMLNNQQYLKTIAVFTIIAALTVAGISATAFADEHDSQNQNLDELDEDDELEIRYSTIVGLYGGPFESGASNEYLIEAVNFRSYGDSMLDMNTLDGRVVPGSGIALEEIAVEETTELGVLVDTGVYNPVVLPEEGSNLIDPQGQYLLREPIQGANVQLTDQHPEAPNNVQVVIDNAEFEGGATKVVNLTSKTNANEIQPSDYTWVAEFGPQDGIVEDGSNPYGPANRTTLLDESQYDNIVYEGLDGVYELSNVGSDDDYYPGSLTFLSDSHPIEERPKEGAIELDNGTTGISVEDALSVQYTDVNNQRFIDETPFTGPVSEGSIINFLNEYIRVGEDFTDTQSYEDTSLNISIVSDREVTADYVVNASGADPVTRKDGFDDRNFNSGSADETGNYTAENSREIVLSEDEVLLDTIEVQDNFGSIDESDIEVLEANRGNGVRLRFPDLSGEPSLTSDRFRVTYDYISPNGSGETRQEVNTEVVVPFGTEVDEGETVDLSNDNVVVEVEEGEVQLENTFNITLDDRTVSTPDTLDLIERDEAELTLTSGNLTGSAETVEFLRDINQSVVEPIGEDGRNPEDFITNINPGSPSNFTLAFNLRDQQTMDIEYHHYQDVNTGVSETLVQGGPNGEYGPSGLYDLKQNDPRFNEFSSMTLEGANATQFNASVESGSDAIVRIDEQASFSGLTGSDVELTNYVYSLGEERFEFGDSDSQVDVDPDGTSEFEYDLAHDHEQVSYDFTVDLNTEDGLRSDTVTLTDSFSDTRSIDSSGVNTLVVDNVQINKGIHYRLVVTDGEEMLGTFEPDSLGANYNNLTIELDDTAQNLNDFDGETLNVRMERYAGLDSSREWIPVRNEQVDVNSGSVNVGSVVEDDVTIDSTNGQLEFGAENAGTPLDEVINLNWTLESEFRPGDRNEMDQRVYTNRLNTDGNEPIGPTNVPVGTELVVAGNEFEPGDELILRPKNRENRTDFAVSLTVEESDTVNENQVVINTSVPQEPEPGQLTDRFELVDSESGDLVFDYDAVDQNLDAIVNPELVNLNRDSTADLNITSELANYDVLVSSDKLDAEKLMSIFPESVKQEYDIEIEAPDDEDNEQVRLNGLVERPENVELELASIDPQEYTLQIDAVESEASAEVTFETVFGPEGSAEFASPIDGGSENQFTVAEGDTVRIGVNMDETSRATLSFTGEDFNMEDIVIEADSDDDNPVLLMDTYLLDGEDSSGTPVDFEDAISVANGEIVSAPPLAPVTERFETGLYPMNLEVNDRETDLGTLIVEDRTTEEVNTWVMPRDLDPTLENVEESAVQQEEVAMGDNLIVEMSLTGFDSKEILTNNTDPDKLVNPYKRAELDDEYDTAQEFVEEEVRGVDTVANASQVNLEVVGDKPRNRPSPHLLLDQATEIRTIVDEGPTNRVFVFFDLNQNTFDNFNSDFDLVETRDHLNDYDLTLNFTDTYKYNDDEADFETEMGVNERVVYTQMPATQVEEEGLETRWTLEAESNSTVRGYTHVAPGTELSVIVKDDVSKTVQESPLTLSKEVTVQEDTESDQNDVTADFDLTGLESGRNMTLQFFGINDFPEPAIIAEADVPPNVTDISASFDGSGAQVGDEITFDSTVEDVDPTAVEYDWEFDDGSDGSAAPSPTHIYEEAGNFNVTLTVTDPATGLSDSAQTVVQVTEVPRTPPEIVDLLAPTSQVEVGETVEFGVVARDDQVQAENLVYNWDFDDGTTSSGITASHSYGLTGTYEVQVTVVDPGAENPDEFSVTETVFVEVVEPSDSNDGNNGENNETNETTTYDLTINTVDAEAGEPLPGTQIQIVDGDTSEPVDTSETQTDANGQLVLELEEGNYLIEASLDGYEDQSTGVQLQSDSTEQIDMAPNSTGGGGDGGGSPDQPGFTLILAAVGLVAAGGYIVYRRRMS